MRQRVKIVNGRVIVEGAKRPLDEVHSVQIHWRMNETPVAVWAEGGRMVEGEVVSIVFIDGAEEPPEKTPEAPATRKGGRDSR